MELLPAPRGSKARAVDLHVSTFVPFPPAFEIFAASQLGCAAVQALSCGGIGVTSTDLHSLPMPAATNSSGGSHSSSSKAPSHGPQGKHHSSMDSATPFHWHLHSLVWGDSRCEKVGLDVLGSLSKCKSTCLADERCSSFNFNRASGLGCEYRHCADGELPSESREGWEGYSTFRISRKPEPRGPPPSVQQLPRLLSRIAIGAALLALLAFALHRVWHMRGKRAIQPAARQAAGGGRPAPIALSAEPASPTAHEAADALEAEQWSPVLTDPVISCGNGRSWGA